MSVDGLGVAAAARLAREADVLAAFRAVTGWTDEEVLHYASCGACTPICGMEEEDCPASPGSIQMAAYAAERTRRLRG